MPTTKVTAKASKSARVMTIVPSPSKVSEKAYSSCNKFAWTKVDGASGYRSYRSTGNGSFKTLKTITSGSTVSYKGTSARDGVKYTYCVKAYVKAGGITTWSSASKTLALTAK